MPVDFESPRDPRARLVREKYFSVRPKPLERWLWSKSLPASAERVFWLHWQEGHQRGDWCSEIPLRRVAHECNLDVSTVTRAYQCLVRLGCLRRTDPGRDPSNPFQQATAVTEVRIPVELLQELHRYPNRRQSTEPNPAVETGRAHASDASPTASFSPPAHPSEPIEHPEKSAGEGAPTPIPSPNPFAAPQTSQPATPDTRPTSSLLTLTGRDRAKALAEITALLSPTERDAYHGAIRLHLPTMSFDPNSKLPAEQRTLLIEALRTLAADPETAHAQAPNPRATTIPTVTIHTPPKVSARALSLFQIARLKRDIQSATSNVAAPELLRQVLWSIESGALRRFTPLHALNIALKKIRAGTWTRPHRMPPNWARGSSASATRSASPHETCSAA